MTLELNPSRQTGGELERAQAEWLHTNGAGAYSMSTVAFMHTRRYHGLLVAALEAPVKRYVILSHLETNAEFKGRVYRLATHQFPNVAPTPGYRLLQAFANDPIPRWVYRLGKYDLERRLCLVRGKNAIVLSYTWNGKAPLKLSMKPLLPMRPIHVTTNEHGAMMQRVMLRKNVVEIRPIEELPSVVFQHSGTFVGSPDWWRRFEFLEDQQRGAHFQEDLWSPGTFEMSVEPGCTEYLSVALGELPGGTAAEQMSHTCDVLRGLDPGQDHSLSVRALSVAAEQYRADDCERPGVIAGYPWLAVDARDTLICIPGLYLAQGLVEPAKRVLGTIIDTMRDGVVTRGILEHGEASDRGSADSTLWLFEATRQLVTHTGTGDEFVRTRIYPALRSIYERVTGGRREELWATESGLIVTPDDGSPHTWMDSRSQGVLVTPRHGAAVELQALWGAGLATLETLATEYGDAELADGCRQRKAQLRESFQARFWCEATRYPYDCVSAGAGEDDSWVDAAIRPNAVIALAVCPEMFERWQATHVVSVARDHLLTPRGLRTLSPADAKYTGHYEGAMEERRAAYHQGVVWGYLLGFFARAALHLEPDDFELQMDLHDFVEQALQNGPVLGQVAQIATGDAPHRAGGCPAQAWSVAELLRTLKVDLHL